MNAVIARKRDTRKVAEAADSSSAKLQFRRGQGISGGIGAPLFLQRQAQPETLAQRDCEVCEGEPQDQDQDQERFLIPVQAKLMVGAADDPLEREADEVADRVMRRPAPVTPSIPRQSLEEVGILRLETQPESADFTAVSPSVENAIQTLPTRGQPMPDSVRSFMEPRFNADFGGVRIHTDHHAHDLARSVDAKAFTVGCDIIFGNGHYTPWTERGLQLFAHELTHVVQQTAAAGRQGLLTRQRAAAVATPIHGIIQRNPAQAYSEGDLARIKKPTELANEPDGKGRINVLGRGNLLKPDTLVKISGAASANGWLPVRVKENDFVGKSGWIMPGYFKSAGSVATAPTPPSVTSNSSRGGAEPSQLPSIKQCGLRSIPSARSLTTSLEEPNACYQMLDDAIPKLQNDIRSTRKILEDTAQASEYGFNPDFLDYKLGAQHLVRLKRALDVALSDFSEKELRTLANQIRAIRLDLEFQPDHVRKFTDCTTTIAGAVEDILMRLADALNSIESNIKPLPQPEEREAAAPATSSGSNQPLHSIPIPRMEIESELNKIMVPSVNIVAAFKLKFKGEAIKDSFTAVKVTANDLRVEATQRLRDISSSWLIKLRSDGTPELETSAKIGRIALKCSLNPLPDQTVTQTCKVESDVMIYEKSPWRFIGKLTGEISVIQTRRPPPLPPVPIRPPIPVPGRRKIPVPVVR